MNQNTHASKIGIRTSVLVIITLLLAILINTLVGMLPSNLRKPNISGESTFKINNATEDYIKSIDEHVTLYFISEGGVSGMENEIYLFLSDLARINPKISLQVIDPQVDTEFIVPYGGTWPENMSIIVESQKRYQLVSNSDLYYYYNQSLAKKMRSAEYDYYCQQFLSLMSQNSQVEEIYRSFIEDTLLMFDGCSMISNSIQYVLSNRIPVVYFLTENATIPGDQFVNELYLSGYDVKPLSSAQSIPNDCELLVIHCPSKDLSDVAAAALKNYLSKGGKLFLSTNVQYGAMSNLNSVLQDYGLSFPEDMSKVVCEGNQMFMYNDGSQSYPNYILPHRADHPATERFSGNFAIHNCHAIQAEQREGVSLTNWLYTTDSAYLFSSSGSDTEKPDTGIYNLGVIAEKGESCVIWMSGTNYADSAEGKEMTFTVFNWLVDTDNKMLSLDASSVKNASLSFSSGQIILWGAVLAVILPAAALATGLYVKAYRRKR